MKAKYFYLHIVILFLFIVGFFLAYKPAEAQLTCDLCGYCSGATVPGNWSSCVKCIYPESFQSLSPDEVLLQAVSLVPPAGTDTTYTVFGCISTDKGGFTNFFINFITSIVGAMAFLGIIYGGIKIMIARGSVEDLTEGKRYVYGSILGLIVVIFSVFIIKTIGGQILQIPFLK